MFRTFDKIKAGKGAKPIAKTNRTNNNNSIYEKDPNKLGVKPREFNLNDDFGESPFDMAPDLQK